MRIEVTRDDILHGKREDCEECPVALAISRAMPEVTMIGVGTDEVDLWMSGDHVTRRLPEEVREFIVNFDDGHNVEPFMFEFYP